MQEKTTAIKATETAKRVRSIVKGMNARALEAKANGIPVAYCMTGSQYDELILAFGIVPVWTENWAGLCAAKRDAERFLTKAEDEGYANVICGYTRVGLGFDALKSELHRAPENSPDGGMAEPDMLLGSSSACDPRYKWYQSLGRYKSAPFFSLDIVRPAVGDDLDEIRPHYIKYQVAQFEELTRFLERQTGRRLDQDKFDEAFEQSQKTWRLWYEVDQLRQARPCPMPSQDGFNTMVPAMFLCGTGEATKFYEDLYSEVRQRVDNRVAVLEKEDYRMLWGGGLPPWHTMWMFNYFEKFGAVFAMENGYRGYDPVEIPSNMQTPFERLAWRSFGRFSQYLDKAKCHSGNATVEKILEYVDEYKIDGILMHATKSCRAMTVGQVHIINLLRQYCRVPVLHLASDIIDMREHSEVDWKNRIDCFMETMKTSGTI